MHTGFWWGSLKEIDVMDRGILEDGVKMGLKKSDRKL
jgi:hypothetical protein